MATTTIAKPMEHYWVPGDWNAFFGFGTNILVNLLDLTGAAALRSENAGFAWSSAASCPRPG